MIVGLLRQTGWLVLALVAAWILSMISLPIIRWTLGDASLTTGVYAGVLLQVLAVLAILWRGWGALRTLATAVAVMILAWLVEALGSTTGAPFGAYDYTPVLQPQLGGVPLLIPLAWLMMLPPAWAVATMIAARYSVFQNSRWHAVGLAVFSGLAFTAWDLFLDPQMVGWNFWTWRQPGGYFGIPWTNYLGWFVVSSGITLLIRPKALPLSPLIVVYGITWALETIGQLFFWNLPGPAAFGFLGMGGMLFWACYRWKGPL